MRAKNRTHFLTFSMGMMLTSFIFTLSPLVTQWFRLGINYLTLMVAWAPLWMTIGAFSSARVSDVMGRRKSYYFNLAFLTVGDIIFASSGSVDAIFVALAFLIIGAGGEYSSIMSSTHEIFESPFRGTVMLLELNFINVGGAIAALLLLIIGNSPVLIQRESVVLIMTVMLMSVLASRPSVKESKIWKAVKDHGSTMRGPSIRFRLAVVIVISLAEVVGFNLMVSALGPYFFPHYTSLLIFLGNATEATVGISAIFLDKFSRRIVLSMASIGGTATFAFIYLTSSLWVHNISSLLVPFILYNGFISVLYMSVNTLNGELWPTSIRATYTALVSSITIGALVPMELLLPRLGFGVYMDVAFGTWICGSFAALSWLKWGTETGKGRGVFEASGERLNS
ncbi:MAG: MFS transporter [Thaumarchaeota archaeon]|nr:MFS transporter [Nitrososphaerota archaeon]